MFDAVFIIYSYFNIGWDDTFLILQSISGSNLYNSDIFRDLAWHHPHLKNVWILKNANQQINIKIHS